MATEDAMMPTGMVHVEARICERYGEIMDGVCIYCGCRKSDLVVPRHLLCMPGTCPTIDKGTHGGERRRLLMTRDCADGFGVPRSAQQA